MPKTTPGQHANLNVTKEANHRVFVGIGWDPNDKSLIRDLGAMMKGRKSHHDLDLSCYVFNGKGEALGCISADPEQAADESGKIYHSGDNTQGLGEGDDEQISIELKDLDADIHHAVFVVTIKSGHNFSDVASPRIRLGDGYSYHVFLESDLKKAANNNSPAFVFVRLYRDGSSGWKMHNISAFVDAQDNWPGFIRQYLGD